MNYNLKDFLSFKLNINQFEELAFAGSNFSVQKNMIKNVLLAEELHDQSADTKSTVNDVIPGAHIEIDEKKESLLSKISKKISDFFKPKPKVYRLTNNESLELDGEVPGNPVGGFIGRITNAIEKFTNKGKEIKEAATVKNTPQIISEHPTVQTDKKVKSDPSLLNEGTPAKNPNIIVPVSKTSYIQSTPPPTLAVEEVTVEGADELANNKEVISKMTEELTTSDKAKEDKAPVQPVIPTQDRNDDYTK